MKLIRYSSVHFLSKPDSNQLMPPPNLYKQTVLQILTTGMERNGVNWLHERKVVTCEHLYRIKEQLKWVLKNQFFHVFTLNLFTSLFNVYENRTVFIWNRTEINHDNVVVTKWKIKSISRTDYHNSCPLRNSFLRVNKI